MATVNEEFNGRSNHGLDSYAREAGTRQAIALRIAIHLLPWRFAPGHQAAAARYERMPTLRVNHELL